MGEVKIQRNMNKKLKFQGDCGQQWGHEGQVGYKKLAGIIEKQIGMHGVDKLKEIGDDYSDVYHNNQWCDIILMTS